MNHVRVLVVFVAVGVAYTAGGLGALWALTSVAMPWGALLAVAIVLVCGLPARAVLRRAAAARAAAERDDRSSRRGS